MRTLLRTMLERGFKPRITGRAAATAALLAAAATPLSASPVDLVTAGTAVFPTADTMTIDPTDAHPMAGLADDYNFGASGSISIASDTARALRPDENIDLPAKGLYRAAMKFDASIAAGQQLSDLELSLYTNNGNAGAKGLFNIRGSAGTVNVYWIVNDWIEGAGLPQGAKTSYSDDYLANPLTDNSLDRLLTENAPTLLTSFDYDGLAPYGTLTWYTWSLGEALENPAFAAALAAGQEISLLLSAAEVDLDGDGLNDNTVGFNFISHRSEIEGPVLNFVPVPEPASAAMMLAALGAAMLRRRGPAAPKSPSPLRHRC